MRGNSENMNLRIYEERTTRSKSPKRYSLNRKTKEKERKQLTDFVEVEKQSPPVFLRRDAVSDRCGQELPSYDVQGKDCSVVEKEASAAGVAVGRDNRVCFNSPVTEKKKCRPPSTPHDITTKNLTPSSRQPGVNKSPMVPCSPGDFRSIANQLKNNRPRRPENPFYAQVPYTNCSPSYGQHYGNFQGAQNLQSPSPLHGGAGGLGMSHSTMMRNIPQENNFVQPYMLPNQGPGFPFGQISMQRNSEAYNAFTAYGNPFGIFWSRQN